MPHKTPIIAIIVFVAIVLLALAGAAYWYFLMGPVTAPPSAGSSSGAAQQKGFQPLGRDGAGNQGSAQNGSAATSSQTEQGSGSYGTGNLPVLRSLSTTPVGGYGVTANGATTTVHWIDRGRGNVYEATYDSPAVTTLSNTVVPKIYASAWNKSLTAFIGSVLNDDDSTWMAVYTQLIRQTASSSQTDVAPYSLHGKRLPSDIIGYAVSPKKDSLFMLINEGGNGVGYVSSFDGSKMTKIFSTPLTQVNVDWPSDNMITVATNGSADSGGFFYSVNPKTGVWTKILGPIAGLSAIMSHDGKYVLISSAENNGIVTSVYSVSSRELSSAIISTLADKCVWGNYFKNLIYCAVPAQQVSGAYPDDWYKGTLSTNDKIWQVNADSGRADLLYSLSDHSDWPIDAFNLGVDLKDNYLFFMNKNDLSLWSLDLVRAH